MTIILIQNAQLDDVKSYSTLRVNPFGTEARIIRENQVNTMV